MYGAVTTKISLETPRTRPPPPLPLPSTAVTPPANRAMVTDAAAMAVVKAARPAFRGAHDGVAFAANAAFLAAGYSLCAVGPAALTDPPPSGARALPRSRRPFRPSPRVSYFPSSCVD